MNQPNINEITSLNFADLDVEELERRLELAATTPSGLDCWSDSCQRCEHCQQCTCYETGYCSDCPSYCSDCATYCSDYCEIDCTPHVPIEV